MLRKKRPHCAVCGSDVSMARCGGCGAPQPGFVPAPRVSTEAPSQQEWELAVRRSLVKSLTED